MLKKIIFLMMALIAVVPLRAAEDKIILYDNSDSKFEQVYVHWWNNNGGHSDFPGFEMTHIGNDIWVYINNGEIPDDATGANFNKGIGGVNEGNETVSKKFEYGKVFNNSGSDSPSDKTISEFYAIHGQIIDGSIDNIYDWKTFPLSPENGKWQMKHEFKSGAFGLKKLNQNGVQLMWYNYTGKNDSGNDDNGITQVMTANDQDASLSSNAQNYYLNDGGQYTFVFDPVKPELGFYKDYNPGEQPEPEQPEEPTVTPLYLLHESMYTSDWGSGNPKPMTYDEVTKTYSIHVDGRGAFGLSRTNLNGPDNEHKFWQNDFLFRPRTIVQDGTRKSVQYSFIHFVEPEGNFYNAEHGAKPQGGVTSLENNDNFRTHTGGTIKVKYDQSQGLAKIWYEPDEYPDLYILGAIIANADETQKTEGEHDETEQWSKAETMVKYKDANGKTVPGLYYYDLGMHENFETGLFDDDFDRPFNLNDYIAKPNKDGDKINEIGHFNFSLNGTCPDGIDPVRINPDGTISDGINPQDRCFWADPFAPVGGGMHDLDRNGTPGAYTYRDFDSMRDYKDGGWTSTNYVFKERCRIWADVQRQLVWVELRDKKLGEGEVMFTFWDKRGETYPADKYNYLRWWESNLRSNNDYKVELVVFKDNDPSNSEVAAYSLNNSTTPWTTSIHSVNGVTDGIYHGISSTTLSEELIDAAKTLAGSGNEANFKNYLWVRISDVHETKDGHVNGGKIIRPYVEGAIYTQAIKDGQIDNTPYGDITEGDLNITMTPDLRVIPNATEASRMTGGFDGQESIVYPAVNQYQTVISFTDPFTIEPGMEFSKSYSINGYIGDKKFSAVDPDGQMTQIRLTGINHVDGSLDDFDRIYVEINYKSPGMSFTRTYERQLPQYDWDEDANGDASEYFDLPVMNHGIKSEEDYNDKLTEEAMGALRIGPNDGDTGETGYHYVVDLVLHKTFEFREEMQNSRAAYIRYSIHDLMIDKLGNNTWVPYDGSCLSSHSLSDSEAHAAQNGVPLTYYYNEQTNIMTEDNWYKEAFLNKQMDIELPHILCADQLSDIKGKIKGKVIYELIVPIADEIKAYFETPEPSALSARRKVNDGEATGPDVDNYVPGYDNNEYAGTLSAPSDSNPNIFKNDYMDEFVFEYGYERDNLVVTGIEEILGATEVEYEYYNLQGLRIDSRHLTPGIYIRRGSDGKSCKIYIR